MQERTHTHTHKSNQGEKQKKEIENCAERGAHAQRYTKTINDKTGKHPYTNISKTKQA